MTRRLPVPTEDSLPFWQGCNEGRLRFQRCSGCGELNWFPRRMCRSCSSDDLAWRDVEGTATVYTFSIVRHRPGANVEGDYVLALVDVDDGPRMVTHIEAPVDDVKIGMRVAVDFRRLSDEINLPVFRPIGG